MREFLVLSNLLSEYPLMYQMGLVVNCHKH